MSASYAICAESANSTPTTPVTQERSLPQWFAVQTRCRFEKKVAAQLRQKG
ncbi:MAG: hypothetical protein WAK56_21400 [Candidatus Sulfotelmatobacter sp.]